MPDVRNLTKSFGGPSGRRVLDGVQLSARPGDPYSVIDRCDVSRPLREPMGSLRLEHIVVPV